MGVVIVARAGVINVCLGRGIHHGGRARGTVERASPCDGSVPLLCRERGTREDDCVYYVPHWSE